MDIKIDIAPEQINAAVAEAIIKSAIGVELEKSIKKAVDSLSTSYNNPIDHVIASHIQGAIQNTVQEKFGPRLKELVAAKVTEQFTLDIFDKLWQAWLDKSYR